MRRHVHRGRHRRMAPADTTILITGETFEPNCGHQYNRHCEQFYPS
ncbi:hypothetical protein MUK42_34905 [Musa troglodytarum]|uniref:Uncharacterized protein n=1 Tax=Musa troglodytarum TaxID=320322 RepID=A0A9E7H8T2_9LILI|nr:hypothetical protein MUK42_34905 [Musa troglodytarum]URE25713.1 hypothetical protein MUK42_34905 [Musa troglodytarum]